MSKNVIRCLHCGKIVLQKQFDSFGRRNSKVASFCRDTNCYQLYLADTGKRKEYNKTNYDRRNNVKIT